MPLPDPWSTMEIERKFLVPEPPHALPVASSVAIRQGYLAWGAEGEVRLRDAGGRCTLTAKTGIGLVREEREIELDRAQFDALWPGTESRRLEKRRYTVPAGPVEYEIDVYEGVLAGLMIVEVEFASEEEARSFMPSDWFGREVTDDPGYTNASLARNGVPADRHPGDTA